MDTNARTFPDPSRQMAEAVRSIAVSLETSTRLIDRLTRTIQLGYVFVGVALLALGFLIWQGRELHTQTAIMHATTRAMVQSNQALLAELLKRHP